jgi:hypothetical protein
MINKKFGPNGSQFLAIERNMRARKLIGGPGMMGKIHPTIPASAQRSPRMISAMAKSTPFVLAEVIIMR